MICSKCGGDKPKYLGRQCRQCVAAWHAAHYQKPEVKARRSQQSLEWAKAHPERHRQIDAKTRLKRYGLTPEQYAQMLRDQGGGCAICGATTPGRKNGWRFMVDHSHATGKVRGFLCHQCNAAIGLMKEDLQVFNRAIDYLRGHLERG